MDIDTGVEKNVFVHILLCRITFSGFFSACRNFLKFIPCTNFAFVFQPPQSLFY